MTRKIRHLDALRIRIKKMAKGDEYIDYLNETLKQAAKPWSTPLGAFLRTKWRVLNSLKRPHGRGRGRRVIRSRIHLALVLSQVHNTEEQDEAF